MKIPENQNLNNFIFYSNDADADIFRKNIIRALALCLRYDQELLDGILKIGCIKEELLSTIKNKKNLDRQEINFESSYIIDKNVRHIIGISITQAESQLLKNQLKKSYRKKVDLSIQIGKIIVLFFIDTNVLPEDYQERFKKYINNLDAYNRKYNTQYKSEILEKTIHTVLNWQMIFEIIDKRIKNSKKDNDNAKILNDFIIYLQSNLWHLFPPKLLGDIEFTMKYDLDCNYSISDRLAFAAISNRLYYIKQKINIGRLKERFDEIAKMPEIVILSDCGMFETIEIETAVMKNKCDILLDDCLSVSMSIGKNVEEAEKFFSKNPDDFKFPDFVNGYKVNVCPLVFVYKQGSNLKKTRIDNIINEFYFLKNQFFEIQKCCSDLKWKKSNNLNKVSEIISNTVDKNIYWRYDTDWENFVKYECCDVKISIGYEIEIYLPYKKVINFDDDMDNPKLAEEIRNTILEFYKLINAFDHERIGLEQDSRNKKSFNRLPARCAQAVE